jgi:hypothetical protein
MPLVVAIGQHRFLLRGYMLVEIDLETGGVCFSLGASRMTEPDPDHFQMRRIESLSDTIFGVAMTLLAYNLPKSGQC